MFFKTQVQCCGRSLRTTLLVTAVLLSAGCDWRPATFPVEGIVTIDGEPLEFGSITFYPIKEGDSPTRPGAGKLGEGGRYSASSFKPKDGLSKGKYQVVISAVEPIGETAKRWHAPKRYGRASTSGLTVEILKANKDLDFDLSWEGEAPYKPFVEKFD